MRSVQAVVAIAMLVASGTARAAVIDPTLTWNTFLGGTGAAYYPAIAVDGSGNTYIVAESSDSWGSPVRAYSGQWDVFVAKLNADGTLAWNTFLGGSGSDTHAAVAVDGSGHVYVIGDSDTDWGSPLRAFTGTSGFPDVFVAKLDATTGALSWNTFLGGIQADYVGGVTVDGGGNVIVSGSSGSDWGTPLSAFHGGGADVFVVKLTAAGAISWHTFVGGSFSSNFAGGIAVDGSGAIYGTAITDYSSWGSPIRSYGGGADGCVFKLTAAGALSWNTFLGGGGTDWGIAIAVDASSNVYVAGQSDASWGTPLRAYTADDDGFVAKLTPAGALSWNTFLGSTGDDSLFGIAVDASGNPYVTGTSVTTWGTPVRDHSGESDAFAARLTPAGVIAWSTFLGSISYDEGYAIAVRGSSAYVAGYSSLSWGAPKRSGGDVFVAQIPDMPASDLVLAPIKPLNIKIGAGAPSITKKIKLKATDVDTAGSTGHLIKLFASEGDCPAGTIVGLPDFDATTPGEQRMKEVVGGRSGTAALTLNISAAAFTSFNHLTPTRCTLLLAALNVGDPTPSNNLMPLELNVIDANDSDQNTVHENFVKSVPRVQITIPRSQPAKSVTRRVAAGNADILPIREVPGDTLTVLTADGDCAPGMVEPADFDSAAPGQQPTATVQGGRTKSAKLRLTAPSASYTTPNKKSPARCIATVSVSGPGGDSDASNNVITVVIDAIDKNDF